MKAITFILLFLFVYSARAGEKYPELSDWEVISKIKDSTLKKNRTRITFNISGLDLQVDKQKLVWSANKFEETTYLSSKKTSVSKIFISGNYKFMFYANAKYREIIIPKMLLESGYAITVQLNFKSTERNLMVKKPVIYLYPETTTEVNVLVKPKGDMTFTYPVMDEKGWNVIAEPDGDIHVGDQVINYLFWEAEQTFEKDEFDLSTGSIVSKEETISFLIKTLTKIGLNSKEQADFITFWGPQLQQNEQNIIHFVFNEEADIFGELEIAPSPDHVYRVYLLYSAVPDKQKEELVPQIFPTLDRSGFTVIEWGGSDLTEISL
jgi:hypothetical protein